MAKAKKSKIWTICYALDFPGHEDDEPFTATWFAYGTSKEDAKEKFLRDFRQHPEDFYGADNRTEICVINVVPGFSC